MLELKIEQSTKADRFTLVTPFAKKAKPAPRYGGLVPPLGRRTRLKTFRYKILLNETKIDRI